MRYLASLAIPLAIGCAPTISHPSGPTASVHLNTVKEKSFLPHGTRVQMRHEDDSRWSNLGERKSVAVRPGLTHFTFEGEWYGDRGSGGHHHHPGCFHWSGLHLHHHHHHGGGGGGVGSAIAAGIVGAFVVGAVIAANASKSRRQVLQRCRAEADIDVGADEIVELEFVHHTDGSCAVECWRDGPDGPGDCDGDFSLARRNVPSDAKAKFISRD